jgi:hypothetical protein
MTEEELLIAHRPMYYFDRDETILPVNYVDYVRDKEINQDSTVVGVVERTDTVLYLHYFLYYMSDGGLEIFEIKLGSHKYDMEQLTVEVTQGGVVKGVMYRPHGQSEHFQIRSTDLSRVLVGNKRPRVYVSKGKHGQYPVSGTIQRYFGAVNDECDPGPAQDYTVLTISKGMRNVRVDGQVQSISSRMRQDERSIPVTALSSVKTRMLFQKFW